MSDALLGYYNRELAFLRQEGAEFARKHPKIAGRLRLGGDHTDDPMVARLIEAVAFLNARIRHKLDDDFPEIAASMLDVLCPHYLRPVPSMSIVQFHLDPTKGGAKDGYVIPRGTGIETDPIEGEPCRFQTSYPTTLWPIRVASASLGSRPFEAPRTGRSASAPWLLRIRLDGLAPDASLGRMAPSTLRFFLMGKASSVYELYEALFVDVIDVALATGASDPNPQVLGRGCIRPVGFEPAEAMLPYSPRSFEGYRLLTEFFAFPSKFLFFDIEGLDIRAMEGADRSVELFFYLGRIPSRLEPSSISADTFRLGCTPIVNLYRKRAEPLRLSHEQAESRVVPDIRRPWAHEVYSIDRVTASSPSGEEVEYHPFYGRRPHGSGTAPTTYWHATRRAAAPRDGRVDHGTEVYLTLVDLAPGEPSPQDATLHIETTCLGRDLPASLPFGGGQPRLHLDIQAPVGRVECLIPPTPTRRPPLKKGVLWPLISHLTLNHLSISGEEGGAEALRAILNLYDCANSDGTRSMIDGLISTSSRRVVGRVSDDGEGGIVRGIEISILFDEDRFSGHGLFVLASVLERFFGLYCSINSFTRLVASTRQRGGELKRWPGRAGERILL